MTAESTQGKMRTVFWTVGVAAVVLALIFGIRRLLHEDTPVRVAVATYQDLVSTISTNGKVEPIQAFEAHAASPGTVQKLLVREGDHVAAGTLMVQLDDSSALARVATARAGVAGAQGSFQDMSQGGSQEERISIAGDLNRTRLQVQQAQLDLSTLQKLQAKGAASASEVNAAQSRLATAQANLDAVQKRSTARFAASDKTRSAAQLADNRANLMAAEKNLAFAMVRAPFAGIVYSLPIRAYEFLNTGDEILRMADLNRMQVRAYFDEPDVGKLAVGQKVRVTWDARPSRAWHGHIVHTPSTIITYGTRNVGECLIAIDDAAEDLLPNTNVNALVTLQQKPHVLTVPREALRTQPTQNFVYRVVKNELVKTPVEVGAVNLTLVEIVHGLSEHDTVALNATNSDDLTPGLSVKPVQ